MARSQTDRVVVTAALTGVLARREQCPAIPYTAAEIGEEAKRAHDAGAAVVHIHAREDDGSPSFRVERYAAILREVRARCPVLVNFSTGAIGIPMQERVAHITQLKPDLGALNMGSMNYAKFSASKRCFVFDHVFQNPFADIVLLLEAMQQAGVRPELECFDVGHVNSVPPLVTLGLLTPPLQFSLILGVLGGIAATAPNLHCMVANLPAGSLWESIVISHEQWRIVAATLALGGNLRVGLEDNFYLDTGHTMAGSNGELVAKAVRMARDAGREPASVEEARALLQLPARG